MLQPFQRFVQTGRVAYIADGKYRGKLCAIVDVINPTKVLIDGPESGVPRGAMRLNQLHLTKFRIKFPHTSATRVVRRAWNVAKVNDKWSESIWAKKVENKKKRSEMTDFDRFKLSRARRARNKLRTHCFLRLKKLKAKEVREKAAGGKGGKAAPEKSPAKKQTKEKKPPAAKKQPAEKK
ncbi:hypothetical protein AAG570_004817 [Ranatra chinensis]|uniref:Large ribosomal subunit protein eL14 n=1 Tax=Ranatra chinensis TaxID=642074 RepID=A0ABD0Y3C4_9HEMI